MKSKTPQVNPEHAGGRFDDFLREEGIFETVNGAALRTTAEVFPNRRTLRIPLWIFFFGGQAVRLPRTLRQ